jgi:hypothetical protein
MDGGGLSHACRMGATFNEPASDHFLGILAYVSLLPAVGLQHHGSN